MNLIYPLTKKGTKTSSFGYRTNPKTGKKRHHNGIDIGVESNTRVNSVADGEVVRSDMKDYNGYGNFIVIKHNTGQEDFYSAYAHLNKRLVNVGDIVKQGQEIALSGGSQGLAGGSGSSTGSHLHFEIRKTLDGQWIDPEPYIQNGEIFSGDLKGTEETDDTEKNKDSFKDLNLSQEQLSAFFKELGKIPLLGAKKRKELGYVDENHQITEDINRMKNLMKKIL